MAYTEEQLTQIEKITRGEDHPGDLWFIETIQSLVREVRVLQEEKRHWLDPYQQGKELEAE